MLNESPHTERTPYIKTLILPSCTDQYYIFFQIAERDYSYFPVNRALTLAKVDDDSADYKIDEILEKLNKILNKQNAEVCKTIYILQLWIYRKLHKLPVTSKR